MPKRPQHRRSPRFRRRYIGRRFYGPGAYYPYHYGYYAQPLVISQSDNSDQIAQLQSQLAQAQTDDDKQTQLLYFIAALIIVGLLGALIYYAAR